MTCYHPIKAFIVDDNGQDRKFHFASVDTNYVVYNHQRVDKYVLLPCGKCIGCRVERSRQWATRMMLEMKYHDCASFITLTYNEDYVPYADYVDEDGELHDGKELPEKDRIMTLRKRDWQLFMKRLRRQVAPAKIRFFACGEYGPKNKRPHYHAIIFGYDFPDKVPLNVENGYVQYRSPLLERIWTDPETHESLGFSMICQVNWNTCAYVARYCTKKYEPLRNIYYQTLIVEPEFQTMSRRPGLGRQYFEDNYEQVYINQELFMQNAKGGFKTLPPKYYDRLYEKVNPLHMEEIKEKRKEIAEEALESKMRETNLNLAQYLEVAEEKFIAGTKSLRREKA